jgi:putative hemolysin
LEFFIIIALIFINAFFSLSEIALVSSKKIKLEQLAPKNRGARLSLKLLEDSENFLSAIQIGITLVGIVTGAYGGMNLADDLTPFIQNIAVLNAYAYQIALSLVVMIITYLSIVLGELVPKTIALSNPEKTACLIAPVIFYFCIIFSPIVKILSYSTNLINKILGIKKSNDHLTEDELRYIIKAASTDGVIQEEQEVIHKNLFYFSDKKAKHILTHRTEVDWIDINQPLDQIADELMNQKHSKIICCDDSIDNISGFLNVKDFLIEYNKNKHFDLKSIINEPLVITENYEAKNLLNLFRQKQLHFCIVVNEYGGFEGIITLFDVMESIIGDIPEEGEEYEPDIFVRDDESVLVSGDAPLEKLTEVIPDFDVNYEEIDYSTVAGFVFNMLNKIPKIGDKFEFMDYIIEVVDTDSNRVDKVLIQKIKKSEDD